VDGKSGGPERGRESLAENEEREDESFWSAYWERFRRQEVDDPVEERREGLWDRFKREDVDDPVSPRGDRPAS
jgi:hypothetical protein